MDNNDKRALAEEKKGPVDYTVLASYPGATIRVLLSRTWGIPRLVALHVPDGNVQIYCTVVNPSPGQRREGSFLFVLYRTFMESSYPVHILMYIHTIDTWANQQDRPFSQPHHAMEQRAWIRHVCYMAVIIPSRSSLASLATNGV